MGPFLGLNTTTDPSELPPQYATVCRNVILSDGRIRPRAPWSVLAGIAPNDRSVLGMYYWHKDDVPTDAFVIAKIGTSLYRIPQRVTLGNPVTFLTELSTDYFANMVRYRDFLYVLDGSDRLVKTDGTTNGTLLVGIDPPHPNRVSLVEAAVGGSGINASVSYKITYYDSDHGIESNPVGPYSFVVAGAGTGVKLTFAILATPGQQGITHIRLYRQNTTLGQVGFRLLAELSVNQGGPVIVYSDTARGDTTANEDADVTLSSWTAGPFAPALNKVPRYWALGAIYNGRLFAGKRDPFNDPTGRVHYSVVNFPDYEEETTLDVSGDVDEHIRGLAVAGDQLAISKRRNIWILTGEVITASNDEVALGQAPLDPSHRLYRTNATIGSIGQEGNNMIVAGQPAQFYFPSDAGWAAFNGVDVRILSDAISQEWRQFVGQRVGRQRLAFSFADDSQNGVLYVAVSLVTERDPIQCLAYHYRVNRGDGIGAWSVIDGGNQKVADETFAVTAVASMIARTVSAGFEGQAPGTPLLIGTSRSAILSAKGEDGLPFDQEAHVPTFEWLSGTMPLARGMAVHVYSVKFFLSRSMAVNGDAPTIKLSVLTNVEERASASPRVTSGEVDVSQRNKFPLPVRGDAETIQIRVERGTNWTKGWNPHLGVLGWQPDVELVGQR